jgi:hypothetical protein
VAQGRVLKGREIRAGTEVVVIAGEDRDPLAVVRLELLEGTAELSGHRPVDGVAPLRPVEMDRGDRAVDLDANRCAHRRLLRRWVDGQLEMAEASRWAEQPRL